MATLIGGEQLRLAVADQSFIKNGQPESVEAVKYDFRMGTRVLKAAYGQPVELGEIPQEKRFVDPGEAVFVLTQERLELPEDMVATLTPKRKLAHSGILVLGGFAIDPLYKGVLLLGLYNFSSTPFALRPGKKIIGALFYKVENEEYAGGSPIPQEISDFPDELVSLIRNYKPVELNGLGDVVQSLRRDLHILRDEVTSDKSWRDDFKSSIQQHNNQLGQLIDSLKEERNNRVREDEKLRDKLDSMSNMFVGIRWAWLALGALVMAVIGAMLAVYAPKLIG